MRRRASLRSGVLAVLCLSGVSALVSADPLPGFEFVKFEQLPMFGTVVDGVVYDGHDEPSYAVGGGDEFFASYLGNNWMADDFADRFDQEIVHLEWWGSYRAGENPLPNTRFLIEFLSDSPADPDQGIPSRPLAPLYAEASMLDLDGLHPEAGEYTETLLGVSAGTGETVYKYNAHLHLPFTQVADTVYWLKIVALFDTVFYQGETWGWHNRDYTIMDPYASTPPAVMPGEHLDGTTLGGTEIWHFQDNAVHGNMIQLGVDVQNWRIEFLSEDLALSDPQNYIGGLDGPPEIQNFSKDLAFVLYYEIPEPASAALLLTAGLMLLARRRR